MYFKSLVLKPKAQTPPAPAAAAAAAAAGVQAHMVRCPLQVPPRRPIHLQQACLDSQHHVVSTTTCTCTVHWQ
jgi:hypothetical protein